MRHLLSVVADIPAEHVPGDKGYDSGEFREAIIWTK